MIIHNEKPPEPDKPLPPVKYKMNKTVEISFFIVSIAVYLWLFMSPGFTCGKFFIITLTLFVFFLFLEMTAVINSSLKTGYDPELTIEPLPANGYRDIRNLYTEDTAKLQNLGFEKVFEEYVRTQPEMCIFIYRHPEENFYVNVYQAGKIKTYDIVTLFTIERGITTSSNLNLGVPPIREGAMLQIFENVPFETLLEKHRQAVIFLEGKGLEKKDITPEEYLELAGKIMREKKEATLRLPFWKLRVLFWIMAKVGKKYAIPVEEQFRRGMIKL